MEVGVALELCEGGDLEIDFSLSRLLLLLLEGEAVLTRLPDGLEVTRPFC